MLLDGYLENLIIYGENLPIYYVICLFISFLALFMSWKVDIRQNDRDNDASVSSSQADNPGMSVLGNISNDKITLLRTIEGSLSSDEKELEYETEKQQLMEILSLMKNDEKFDSVTMEMLQDQLKLYKDIQLDEEDDS